MQDRKNLWKAITYGALGTVILFLVAMYGLRGVTPQAAANANYAVAEKTGGECYSCHKTSTPGLTEGYAHSKHLARSVKCLDCHSPNIKGAEVTDHKGFKIVAKPTPKNCANCHQTEYAQFEASNHAARSWYAVEGAQAFTKDQLIKYNLVDDKGQALNKGKPNAVAVFEGQAAMTLGCKKCHEVGIVNKDGSVGDCSKCHLGHDFSIAQARKPETCAQCHLGPDHPQKEIFDESPHGVLYSTSGSTWNWNAAPGTLTVKDMPGPVCATCHMSAFGGTPGTHNVGERLAWNLTPEIANKRTDWQPKRTNMETVCFNCHDKKFVEKQFAAADDLVDMTNNNVLQGKAIVEALKKEGVVNSKPFDDSIDFKVFELWHHEGRRARFGGMMGGPDFVQWHGIYEQKKDLVELKEMAEDLKTKANLKTEGR